MPGRSFQKRHFFIENMNLDQSTWATPVLTFSQNTVIMYQNFPTNFRKLKFEMYKNSWQYLKTYILLWSRGFNTFSKLFNGADFFKYVDTLKIIPVFLYWKCWFLISIILHLLSIIYLYMVQLSFFTERLVLVLKTGLCWVQLFIASSI